MEYLQNLNLYNHILSEETHHLTPTEKLIAVTIAKHRNNESFKCCPGIKTICKCTNFKRRCVQYSIKRLEEKDVFRRFMLDDYTSRYYFLFDLEDAVTVFNNPESLMYENHHDTEAYYFEIFLSSHTSTGGASYAR